jgi:hypothetical protein
LFNTAGVHIEHSSPYLQCTTGRLQALLLIVLVNVEEEAE